MSRSRGRRADVIWFICTDSRHRGEPAYDRDGHRVVGTLGISRGGESDGRLTWRGPRAESPDTVSTSGITLSWAGIAPPLPLKQRRRDDGTPVWRFRCTCGRNSERSEPDLAAIVQRHAEMLPGRRAEIDIVRLG